jgi:hypothetical protein
MIAATPTITIRDVPLHAVRSLAAARPPFNMVAFHWRGSGAVRYRVRFADGWSPWRTADGDAAVQRGWTIGSLDWLGRRATALQTRVGGSVAAVRSYTVDSPVERTLARRLALANAPPIIPRLSWGADESIRRAAPRYAPALKLAIVHHTAGTNGYTAAQSAAIVRGIEIYHVQGNGWDDIGYNFLVDKYGQVFEGRYGGVDRNVIGAHTEGFNTGTVGVAVIGEYGTTKITTAAAKALEQLLSWRLDLAHIDPLSTLTYTSGGNSRFPAGTAVTMRAVSGHRDGYFTDCPGGALYAQLPAIAKAVSALGGPKIYAPLAQTLETRTRITARLSVAQPWTVTVTGSSGQQVAQGAGTGTKVDWTWDASLAPPDRYTWTIATANARSATGTVGTAVTAPAVQRVSASPTALRAGETLTVKYTLAAPANVTIALVDGSGQTLATLLTAQKPAGAQTFTFVPPSGFYNGAYSIAVTASSGNKTVTATAPFTMDDILGDVTVTPAGATLTFTRAPSLVTLEIGNGAAPAVAPVAGTQTVTWPKLPDGAYTARLTVTDDVGTFTRDFPLVVDTTPPRVTVLSYANLRFRISEPARLTLVAGTQRYTRVVPKAATTQFWLKSRPARYTLLATDASGNTTTIRYRR